MKSSLSYKNIKALDFTENLEVSMDISITRDQVRWISVILRLRFLRLRVNRKLWHSLWNEVIRISLVNMKLQKFIKQNFVFLNIANRIQYTPKKCSLLFPDPNIMEKFHSNCCRYYFVMLTEGSSIKILWHFYRHCQAT